MLEVPREPHTSRIAPRYRFNFGMISVAICSNTGISLHKRITQHDLGNSDTELSVLLDVVEVAISRNTVAGLKVGRVARVYDPVF